MKPSTKKTRVPKGMFLAGEVQYPVRQLEQVLTAQLNRKPLPTPKRP